jgi:hypothetical protein
MIAYRYPGYDDPAYAASVVLGDVLNSQRSDLFGLVAVGKAQAVEADLNQWPKAGFVQLISHVAVGTQARKRRSPTSKPSSRSIARAACPPTRRGGEAARDRQSAIARPRRRCSTSPGLESSARRRASHARRRRRRDRPRHARRKSTRCCARTLPPSTVTCLRRSQERRAVTSGASAGGEDSAKPESTKIEPLPAWAEAALRHLAPPERTIAPVSFTLSNGCASSCSPNTRARPWRSPARFVHDAGLEEPSGKSGVQSVLEAAPAVRHDDVFARGAASADRCDRRDRDERLRLHARRAERELRARHAIARRRSSCIRRSTRNRSGRARRARRRAHRRRDQSRSPRRRRLGKRALSRGRSGAPLRNARQRESADAGRRQSGLRHWPSGRISRRSRSSATSRPSARAPLSSAGSAPGTARARGRRSFQKPSPTTPWSMATCPRRAAARHRIAR